MELWQSVHDVPRRFLRLCCNKSLTTGATSIEEMARTLREAAELLEAMRADGVTLDPSSAMDDDYVYLVTTDPAVARKYDMHEESEFSGDGSDEGEKPAPTQPT